ncbi:mitochondrial glutamyl-tRNA (Gln) amidotransferase B subunit (GatB/YqeY) [Andalucia godoyi]|uniref:Glutamyl-tRNA(Gln) amidotransferase subunit B, mitochondrial n=1 Tax=Andalucia godoyi TaxID=505711 RepID=A0A8K0AHF1_ANDGO|nr:mitochondrial glutamyl-tRNA (Gln) amidotransferase B subunit (GatB/YqeY) [Andalucia godoyi]|eukprot:ANDGO_04049.mRNA.1 mitochondrial glutamyl-tRNA (Gln) amidotransferase B subunit (GatB/YqeY)
MLGKRGVKWDVVIGIEVHAQILSRTKLFSRSPLSVTSAANENVSLFDAAIPGTLPRTNMHCVFQGIRTANVLMSNVQPISKFDRKHYFYADLPIGYQITQQFMPLSRGGALMIGAGDSRKRIGIERIQLEQDSGQSLHDEHPHFSFINLNRAGCGLMEIISEPGIACASEAVEYVKKLQYLLRHAGTCDGSMENGSLRADVNVSVRSAGSSALGTRCEIKNLNSFRSIGRAIEAEAARQIELLESGKTVDQATMAFDVASGQTRVLRSKENAPDYRYMPDPDLPPLRITEGVLEAALRDAAEHPETQISRLRSTFGLSTYDVEVLMTDPATVHFFETCMQLGPKRDPKKVCNWVTSELFGRLHKCGKDISGSPVSPENLGNLIDAVEDRVVSGKTGKGMLDLMVSGDTRSVKEMISSGNLRISFEPERVAEYLRSLIKDHPAEVSEYKAGRTRVFGFFVGSAMRQFKGKVDPHLVNSLARELLEES